MLGRRSAQPGLFKARPPAATCETRSTAAERAILTELFGPPDLRDFAVRYADGSVEVTSRGTSRFTLVFGGPGAVRRALLPPTELALGEAYLRDDFDVEGDIEASMVLAEQVAARLRSPVGLARLAARVLALPADEPSPEVVAGGSRAASWLLGAPHSRRRDAAAVRFHYDVGNDFYGLWLDRRLIYSCAYFQTGSESLDAAQEAKLEYLCRKLRLRPGERLLDIGCGWGGLVQYAAERYGVEATGITLSEQQATLARERVAAAGLADRAHIEVRDYRDLPRDAGFDKIVSVGMVEHVGRTRLPDYFGQAYRLLRPGGLFLSHGIVLGTAARPVGPDGWLGRRLWREGAFIHRYVFPDGDLEKPHDVLRFAEEAGFETRDVENLREHYALTLRLWVRRLEAQHADAARVVGEPTYRIWRLYMAGSAHAFATGQIGVMQVLLSKPTAWGASHLPLTRADLYSSSVARWP